MQQQLDVVKDRDSGMPAFPATATSVMSPMEFFSRSARRRRSRTREYLQATTVSVRSFVISNGYPSRPGPHIFMFTSNRRYSSRTCLSTSSAEGLTPVPSPEPFSAVAARGSLRSRGPAAGLADGGGGPIAVAVALPIWWQRACVASSSVVIPRRSKRTWSVNEVYRSRSASSCCSAGVCDNLFEIFARLVRGYCQADTGIGLISFEDFNRSTHALMVLLIHVESLNQVLPHGIQLRNSSRCSHVYRERQRHCTVVSE